MKISPVSPNEVEKNKNNARSVMTYLPNSSAALADMSPLVRQQIPITMDNAIKNLLNSLTKDQKSEQVVSRGRKL